jgi:hypothetical protein
MAQTRTKWIRKMKYMKYDKNNIWHVYPVNDLKSHTLEGLECECNPKIQIQDNLAVIVTHKAYDHREWLERSNK